MKKMKIKDILKLKYGKDKRKALETEGNNPILGTGGIIGRTGDFLYDKPSVLIGRKGSVENTYYVDVPFWTIDTLFYTEIDTSILVPRWFYYKTKNIRFERLTEGTGVPSLTAYAINNVKIDVPSLKDQKNVVDKISPFDEKIKQNNELISSLEEYSQLLFHKWFVDFNFPNENENPYKDDGGEMYKKNGRMIPVGWQLDLFGNLISITTGKKDANYSTPDGKYPFYTCSKYQLKSPTYSFDTKAMILAGNGEFWLNMYEGKFEAYQRNYIIESKEEEMFNFLYLQLKKYLNVITSKSAGSIIKYLRLNMITDFPVIIPPVDILEMFNKIIESIYNKIEVTKKENLLLEETRDLLIKKLIK